MYSKYYSNFQNSSFIINKFLRFFFTLALLLREEGKIQESLELFQRTVQINANNVDNLKQVARSLYVENSLSYLIICRNILIETNGIKNILFIKAFLYF